ncbi:MAG: putative ABC transporter permease subunit [Tissierella sp.]|uniref:putative ABC transporter permease subunit n=1 Tax=Tissierella sp. TaxID=41274 RepID=UPI003F94D10C
MKKILSLIKTDLNTTFGLSSIAYSFKNKKDRWKIIIFSIAILSLLPTYFLMVKGLVGMYEIYNEIGQRSMFLLLGFLTSQAMVFLLGLIYVMSKYYFSSDLAQLVPLPIKPSYILGSKFITLMISEYLTSLPIILPFIFIYGIKGSEGVLYWIYSLVLVLIVPVLPLVLSSVLIMIFMKYTNIGGKKDLIRIVSAVLFLILLVYVQLKINTVTQKALMQGNDFLINLVKDSNLLVKNLGLAFPPSMWGALSLSNYLNISGFIYLLIFIGAGVLSFIIMIYLSERIFFDGLIGNIEVSASKGKSGKKLSIGDSTRKTRPYLALAKKEITMLFKTPIYLLNSVGGVILLPIILVMTTISGGNGMAPVLSFIETKPELITLAGIGFIVSLGMLNSVGSTTFSREGKNFWIQRTLPIKVKYQIIGRVLASLTIQILGLIAILGSLMFLINLNIQTIILIAVLGLLGSIPMTQLGMIIDIIRPLLTWTNPQQAMKQNLNVLIGMGMGTLYLGSIGYIAFKLLDRIASNLIFLAIGAVFTVSTVIFYFILEKLIRKQFKALE